jgi:hypothetical protein
LAGYVVIGLTLVSLRQLPVLAMPAPPSLFTWIEA